MKKIAFMSALALCLGFTSCDNYEEPNPPAQSNAPEAVLEANGISMTIGSAAVEEGVEKVIKLAEYNDQDLPIEVAKVTTTDFPASYDLKMVMQVSKDDTFAKTFDVPTTVKDGAVLVSADDMQGAFVSVVGKNPAEAKLYARYAAYAVNGTNEARIGNPDFFYGPMTYSVLPFPSEVVIEEAYYLLGTINGWSVAEAIKFNHSGASVYDDPVFTLAVDITEEQAAGGWWWKIIPESTYVTGNWVDAKDASFGPEENGDESLEGLLYGRTETQDSQAGCVTEANQYLLTINMLEQSYEFSVAVPYLYTPGDSNGWNQGASQMLGTNDYTNYAGYVYLTGGFKFTNAPDWSHTNYGAADEEGVLSPDGGAGNLSVATPGLYYAKVNTASLTYSLVEVTTIGVIGDATPEGWNASTALTPSADYLTWTGDVTFGNGEFKFRANDGWDINLGGDLSDLTQDGSNIASPGQGTYTVTLYLGQLPYSATVVKK